MTAIEQTAPVAAVTAEQRSPSRAWRKLKANKGALVGLVIILFFAAIAIAAPVLPIPDPVATSWSAIRKPPSAAHWLGTDDIGRDILSRMIWGAQASLMAGIFSVAIAVIVGVPLGLVSGYFGGWIDMVISRVTEAFLAMPFLITAIALAAFLGPSLTNAMIAIGLSAMPVFIHVCKAEARPASHGRSTVVGKREKGGEGRWACCSQIMMLDTRDSPQSPGFRRPKGKD